MEGESTSQCIDPSRHLHPLVFPFNLNAFMMRSTLAHHLQEIETHCESTMLSVTITFTMLPSTYTTRTERIVSRQTSLTLCSMSPNTFSKKMRQRFVFDVQLLHLVDVLVPRTTGEGWGCEYSLERG